MQTLLVASDLNSHLELLAHLHAGGHGMSLTSTIGDAHQMMHCVQYDLLLIDLDLPQNDGIRLCALVREAMHDLVIIFLDRGDRVQRCVQVFETGADDIMRLPCAGEELVARAQARQRQRNESVMMSRSRISYAL